MRPILIPDLGDRSPWMSPFLGGSGPLTNAKYLSSVAVIRIVSRMLTNFNENFRQ